jgi:hypothetical protein
MWAIQFRNQVKKTSVFFTQRDAGILQIGMIVFFLCVIESPEREFIQADERIHCWDIIDENEQGK